MIISLDKRVEESKSGINDMDDVFCFKVGIGYGVEAVIEVEIPMSLYNKVCEWVGPETMARYEFGFHFQEILQDKFPEIDQTIHAKIDEWIQGHYPIDISEKVLHHYRSVSAWFEY